MLLIGRLNVDIDDIVLERDFAYSREQSEEKDL